MIMAQKYNLQNYFSHTYSLCDLDLNFVFKLQCSLVWIHMYKYPQIIFQPINNVEGCAAPLGKDIKACSSES